jgi:hypothetical protein
MIESVDYFGGTSGLKEQQKKDKIKKDYCDNNKIKLIIIKYNEKTDNLLTKINKINKINKILKNNGKN